MPENEGRQALSATKAGAHKFLQMGVHYILPLVTFFVGAFSGIGTWGGVNALESFAEGHVTGSQGWGVIHLASAGFYGGMFGAIGYGFWHLDGHVIMEAVGRGFGGYFFGVAVSYLIWAVGNTSASDGLIDNLVADMKGL